MFFSRLTNDVFADIPRDCAEASSWGVRNGIDYSVQGEFLISPDDVRPFLAYCDYNLDPANRESVWILARHEEEAWSRGSLMF